MEERRQRKRVRGMPAESPPEWLPDGWTVEVRNTRRGEYRCYRSPVSGRTFQSKEEVLRHLSVVKHDDATSRRTSCSNESKMQLVEDMKESLEWLPSGWIVEIKTRRSGTSAGKTYKCYFEPWSGNRFYSKVEVLRFLSSRKVHEQTSDDKKHLNKNSTNNVIAHIEYSPDGSPHGWIKETKFIVRNVGLGENPSSASSKKLRSQPTGKKHHLTEEILDSNGELSETVTVPDRLLLPPSSQEIVELNVEESAQESATLLSPPYLLNPRERAPKNGRMRKGKCRRKSIISNERNNMESEKNIKSEEVTEKPSNPSNQTMMNSQSDGKELAKHTEVEAKQGGESKPESVANSKENSKKEDKLTLQVQNVTVKFPLASIKTSKDLLGDEIEPANQKASAEKGEFLDSQNNNLSEMEKELPVVVGNPSTPDLVKPKHGSRKTKAMNAISRPQRLSRRLACVEADLATDVDMGGECPLESKSNNTTTEETPQRQRSIEAEVARPTESLQRKNIMEDVVTVTNQALTNWPNFPSTLPFGDSWLDPCLEFAFKTLTGDLPVLDDTIAIQEYFQQQLFSVAGSTRPDVLAPVSNNKTEAVRTDKVDTKLPN